MKKKTSLLLIILSIGISSIFGQKVVHPSVIKTASGYSISRPLRDNPIIYDFEFANTEFFANAHRDREINPNIKPPDFSKMPADPNEQKIMGTVKTATLDKNFAGQNSSSYPPDCNGSMNADYYFQVVNTTYQIFDKNGTSVAGPSALNSIFDSGLTGASCNSGDPIVLWDEQANRWFYAEFSLCQSNDRMLIAVSTSADPTDTWYSWSFDVDDTPDYMKFGIWQDGYYMATNTGGGNDVYVFDRDAMIAGETSPTMIGFDNPNRPSTFDGFHCILPMDNDGAWAPAGTPGQFITIADDGQSNPADALYIYELDADWSTPGNSTFSRTQTLSVNAFSGNFTGDWNNIKQPGTTQRLDGLSTILMYRAQYRNFGATQKLVCVHAIAESSDEAALRWYQLENTGSGWSIAQQGTYNPDGVSRWNASIAMNTAGEIGMGYSVSDATSTYPGIRFCGQTSGAAPNTMDIAEETIWTGNYSQTSYNRWGDYANISVDPADDRTFWFTSEYKSSSSHGTRIASFRFSTPDDPQNFLAQGVSTSQINLSWNLNASSEPALIAWSSDGTFGTPVDGVTYNSGDAIPGGGIVLSYGTTPLSYNHTGLSPATTYYYKGWSYKTDNTYTNGIGTIGATLTGDPVNFNANAVSTSQIDLTWSLNAGSDNVLVAWSSDGTFGTPVDGTTYNSDDVISGGGTVLSYGTGTSFNHNSLNSTTTYYYKAWSNLNGTQYSPGISDNATTLCGIVTSFPFTEDFETGVLPNCWSYDGTDWTYENGGHNGNPASAHSGTKNALFYHGSSSADVSKLITPAMDMSVLADAQLTFWHTQANWSGDQDELRVYYKTTSGGSWNLLTTYTNNISSWTQETITLPNISSTYFIAFEATGQYGYGVAIDDVTVDGTPACSAPSLQASNFNQDVQNMNNITVSWTRGNGDAVIVLAHESASVNENPGSGNIYVANAQFGLGDEIGTGNFVVYNGTGTSVNISGLSASTEYQFAVYEYYNTDVCYLKPGLQGIANTCYPPNITVQPSDIETCNGNDVMFTLTAIGTNLLYQWQKDGSDISGAQLSSYSITGVSSADLGSYTCICTADCGSPVTSDAAVLSFYESPVINSQPENVSATVGDNISFSVLAQGNNLIYQWRKDGVDLTNGGTISGSTGLTLTINPVAVSDAGSYDVVVSNSCSETVTSNPAVLDVSSAVNTIEQYGIKIYPNPAKGFFNILFNNNFLYVNVKITDISGKIILEKSEFNRGVNKIDLNNRKGIYFVHVNYDGNHIVSKLIIQ